jgi:hypothetical protein
MGPPLVADCLGARLPQRVHTRQAADRLKASRRIRLERQVAYERPVVLQCDIGELTLLPIAGTVTRLFMPFRLGNGTQTLKGELVLGDRALGSALRMCCADETNGLPGDWCS